MGEYVKNIKLGTCENLYYTTFQELKRRVNNGFPASEYLDPKNGFRYRFPFPDEDHKNLFGKYDDYNRGVLFTFPKSVKIELGHDKIFFRSDMNLQIKDLRPFGFYIPCPQKGEGIVPIFDWEKISGVHMFEIVQQKQVEGELQTVVRCPYCGELCRLSLEEIANIVQYVRSSPKGHFTDLQKDIIEITFKGYINE